MAARSSRRHHPFGLRASKILRGILGRKRIEQSLLQAEKIEATGRMAATIAREINNPLEAVINLLYLLRPSVVDPAGISYLSSAEDELRFQKPICGFEYSWMVIGKEYPWATQIRLLQVKANPSRSEPRSAS